MYISSANIIRATRSGFLTTVVFALLLAPLRATERASARLLTIGNSFANDATAFLPEIANAGGKELVIFHANLGGASLERHVSHLLSPDSSQEKIDPRPYKNLVHPFTHEIRDFSLQESLAICPWDFVTIQQVSSQSFRPESYHPFADQLIAAIKAGAPQAEILIHETWSYREDHPLFHKGDGFTPLAMYEGLRAAYHQLALETGCRLIPVGDAFHAARQTPRWHFTEDKTFDHANAQVGQLPDQRASLNLGWYWKTNAESEQPSLILDGIHANTAGRYLGSCVFYLVLFDASRVPADYVPAGLLKEDAAALREIAEQAVEAERTRAGALGSPTVGTAASKR